MKKLLTLLAVLLCAAGVVVGYKYYQSQVADQAEEPKQEERVTLPLGDGKVSTTARKGYVFACSTTFAPATGTTPDWISGNEWEPEKKVAAQGEVKWPSAAFNAAISGNQRVITGNNLPVKHTTGIFPIQQNDPAYQFDKNPNAIKAQTVQANLPASPTVAANATCVGGGPVGVMQSGVYLYNALDASGRDAVAHEVQDKCAGHPQQAGEYHYHSLSSCFEDVGSDVVLGFALDGFAITGPRQPDGKVLTTQDLDECHGMTSEITLDGKKVNVYHYVLTPDYPYSISCFKGTPVKLGAAAPAPAATTPTRR